MTGQHYSDALNYQICMPDGTMLFPGSNMKKQPHWNWRWSQAKVQWGIDNGFIVFKQTKGTWAVYFKQYFNVNNESVLKVADILEAVYIALTEKGYNPVNQIVGYIMSGDPTYITSHNGARSLIMKVERDELVEELLKEYIINNNWG